MSFATDFEFRGKIGGHDKHALDDAFVLQAVFVRQTNFIRTAPLNCHFQSRRSAVFREHEIMLGRSLGWQIRFEIRTIGKLLV